MCNIQCVRLLTAFLQKWGFAGVMDHSTREFNFNWVGIGIHYKMSQIMVYKLKEDLNRIWE